MTDKATHTKGPWDIEHSQLTEGHFITSNSLGYHVGVANLCCGVGEPTYFSLENEKDFTALHRDEILANAHLIAAAPELLEALELCREFIRTGEPNGCDRLAESVIAKAKGQA